MNSYAEIGTISGLGCPAKILRSTFRNLSELNLQVVNCYDCPRLVRYRKLVAREKKPQFSSWSYWGRPVPGFGDLEATILVVGLAPAPHGGNRTGRVFTGDKSAEFLTRALFKAGYTNKPDSVDVNDGLELRGIYMTAAVKCVPPENKPTVEEISNCSRFLTSELRMLKRVMIILCLGRVAYHSTMVLLSRDNLFHSRIPKFGHGLELELVDGRKVIASYHPSPRNTQTGKLTSKMFESILVRMRHIAGSTQVKS